MLSTLLLSLLVPLALPRATVSQRQPLVPQRPLSDLSPLPRILGDVHSSDFTTLSHPLHPNYGMRIKKSSFCDPTVNVYTGYLDVAHKAHHLFFYFFESRNDPSTDDVVMWINGGPGSSSSVGLLMELGPCSIDMGEDAANGNGTTWNPYSWTARANVFFLEQPVGVGYSYADFGQTVETTEDAAGDIQAFTALFFDTFSSFKGRPFHLSGESYGGRYLPVFGAAIFDANRALAKANIEPSVNLKSVIIGNGVTDFVLYHTSRHDIQCGTAALEYPPLDIVNCVRSKQVLPRCEAALVKNCRETFDLINCNAAIQFCDSELRDPFVATGLNVYDVSKPCYEGGMCYRESAVITEYLNRPDIRATLGVDDAAGNYSTSSRAVGAAFWSHLDKYAVPTQEYVSQLLDRGVRVLIYAGTYDWQCNWLGNEKWTVDLEWSGHDDFAAQPLRDWYVEKDGKAAGKTRSTKGFTFATVFGAGHLVPHDKPVEALTLLNRWLDGEVL